jgi:hypothetical protein
MRASGGTSIASLTPSMPAPIADDEARVVVLLDRPWWWGSGGVSLRAAIDALDHCRPLTMEAKRDDFPSTSTMRSIW